MHTKIKPIGETKNNKVLFLCTGNASRSEMAEGFMCALDPGRFITSSVGLKTGIDPLAVDVMKEVGIDIRDQEPKNVAQAVKEAFGYAIVLYDAARERSPIFPFTFFLLHWDIADPGAIVQPQELRKKSFRAVRDQIYDNVEHFLSEADPARQEHGMLVHAAHA